MKTGTFSCLLIATLIWGGCSSVKTKVDSGPIAARTFSFISTGPKTAPAYADTQTKVHAMIQQAIINTLARKGVAFVNSGGDVTVAYLVIAGNNATTTSLNEYFGYTPDAVKLVDKVHKEQAIKSDNRAYFEAGTLVIDIVNPQKSKLLRRSGVQSSILRNLPPDVRQARIQAIVDQALSDLRIVRSAQ